jgi:hypothetical protein
MQLSKALRHRLQAEHDNTPLWGYLIVAISCGWFFLMMFNLVGTKLLPETGNRLLDFLRADDYYSILVPLTIPVALVAIYLNWLGMKLFRHS